MTARDRGLVEAQVGGEAATDLQHLAVHRDLQRAPGALHFEVAPGLLGVGQRGAVTAALVEALDRVEPLGDPLCGG